MLLSASKLIFGIKMKRFIIKNRNTVIEIIKLVLFSKKKEEIINSKEIINP